MCLGVWAVFKMFSRMLKGTSRRNRYRRYRYIKTLSALRLYGVWAWEPLPPRNVGFTVDPSSCLTRRTGHFMSIIASTAHIFCTWRCTFANGNTTCLEMHDQLQVVCVVCVQVNHACTPSTMHANTHTHTHSATLSVAFFHHILEAFSTPGVPPQEE